MTKRLLHFFWFDYHRRQGDENTYVDSNSEIEKWAERCLESRFAVHSTSCVTQGRVTFSKEDILLGHLSWDVRAAVKGNIGKSERNWMHDNRLNPGDLSHPNCFLLTPWVPAFPSEWTAYMPFLESQLEQARLIFAICGRIWFERTFALTESTIHSRVKDKLVRLNMCINSDALTVRKTAFNAIGKRRLIHVSNLSTYKDIDLLLASTLDVTIPSLGSKALKELPRGTIRIDRSGKVYLINNLGPVDNNDEEQIRSLVGEHDFYIHTSSMDAQATTVLEFVARGLVPILTPESGFDWQEAIYLTADPVRNRGIIQSALQMPEEECWQRVARLQERIRREHSWREFFDTIAERISACAN